MEAMLRSLAAGMSHHWRHGNGAPMPASTVERMLGPAGETLRLRNDRLDLRWEADGQLVFVDPSGTASRVAGGALFELTSTAKRRVDETGIVRCVASGQVSESEHLT